MLERQRQGIANAKREGRYKGRVPTVRQQADEIIRLKGRERWTGPGGNVIRRHGTATDGAECGWFGGQTIG